MINDEVDMMIDIFDMIELSSGRNAKQEIIDTFVPEKYKDDFDFCIEVLSGKHKLGYTLLDDFEGHIDIVPEFRTIKDTYTQYLMSFGSSYRERDTVSRVLYSLGKLDGQGDPHKRYTFWYKLCNRLYRLGIGKSLLPIEETSPMLSELYGKKPRSGDYFVTEKLDGVRCISYYDGNDWLFISRNGKNMNVSFDMSEQDTDYIYDGEIIIPNKHFTYIEGVVNAINHVDKDKLTYNIFDMYQNESPQPYVARRKLLDNVVKQNEHIRVVPTLAYVHLPDQEDEMYDIFLSVTSRGGEGVMLNDRNSVYKHKRGSHMLKLKDTWRLDMRVIGLKEGKGKYEGKIGSLECEAIDETYGTRYHTFAGGLSDEEREMTDWIGQIVEIECNGKSQNAKTLGSRNYSIRHARYIRRRTDKTETSTD